MQLAINMKEVALKVSLSAELVKTAVLNDCKQELYKGRA